MEQILALIRQNPFFSAVSVIGTAVSITFVMVIYMVYDIQTADLAPESHRSSMVYSSYGYSYRMPSLSLPRTRVRMPCFLRNAAVPAVASILKPR